MDQDYFNPERRSHGDLAFKRGQRLYPSEDLQAIMCERKKEHFAPAVHVVYPEDKFVCPCCHKFWQQHEYMDHPCQGWKSMMDVHENYIDQLHMIQDAADRDRDRDDDESKAEDDEDKDVEDKDESGEENKGTRVDEVQDVGVPSVEPAAADAVYERVK